LWSWRTIQERKLPKKSAMAERRMGSQREANMARTVRLFELTNERHHAFAYALGQDKT
jgi:hypothetical protein